MKLVAPLEQIILIPSQQIFAFNDARLVEK